MTIDYYLASPENAFDRDSWEITGASVEEINQIWEIVDTLLQDSKCTIDGDLGVVAVNIYAVFLAQLGKVNEFAFDMMQKIYTSSTLFTSFYAACCHGQLHFAKAISSRVNLLGSGRIAKSENGKLVLQTSAEMNQPEVVEWLLTTRNYRLSDYILEYVCEQNYTDVLEVILKCRPDYPIFTESILLSASTPETQAILMRHSKLRGILLAFVIDAGELCIACSSAIKGMTTNGNYGYYYAPRDLPVFHSMLSCQIRKKSAKLAA